MARGAVTGLPIPANAEIVLEGELPPMKDAGDAQGRTLWGVAGLFHRGECRRTPVMVVKRVYYRNDPIMLGAPPLKPPASYLRSLSAPPPSGSSWRKREFPKSRASGVSTAASLARSP